MSKFLAPIHYWLFGKVSVMEGIEQSVIRNLNHPSIIEKAEDYYRQFGNPIGDVALESVIDQGNIHGWLQSKITAVETRQAKLLDYACTILSKEQVMSIASYVYAEEGRTLGQNQKENKLASAPELFKALQDVLLEGMPCDRVAVVTESTPTSHAWDVVACVHESYWNQSQVTVTDYYQLRAAFSKGFVEIANPAFTYEFSNENGQKHSISKTI